MGKPSLQQVFWHRFFFFLSFLHFFLHRFLDLVFLLQVAMSILHFLLSTRPGQLVLGEHVPTQPLARQAFASPPAAPMRHAMRPLKSVSAAGSSAVG